MEDGGMTTVEDVWSLLRTEVVPRDPERVRLEEAHGRVLREPAISLQDQPAFDRSAKDGYAILANDSSEVFQVVGEMRAGDWKELRLAHGQAVKIATGSALPCAACEVVMVEDAEETINGVRLLRRGKNNIRRRGEDAREGDVLVASGRRISAGVSGLLAGVGMVTPLVTSKISTLHIVTGSEIVSPDTVPAAGQVRDSNSAMVRNWLSSRGIVASHRRVGEDLHSLLDAMRGERDLLLISGGSSVGTHDNTERALVAAGFDILVSKISMRPGKPLIVGRRGDEWVIGLPGNPLSHFVCLNLFVSSIIASMEGSMTQHPKLRKRLLTVRVPGDARETWWPAIVESNSIRPLRWKSSGDLTSLARADALLRVPTAGLVPGTIVEFIRAL